MNAIVKIILDYLWGKAVPLIIKFFKDMAKKAEINKEVDQEHKEVKDAKELAKEWAKKNPGKPLPKDIENKLRDAGRKFTNGMH